MRELNCMRNRTVGKMKTLAGFMVLVIGILQAGTTGKITGIATDAESGEPLIGCNVMLEGTVMGAATGYDGNYIILNVPPGDYTISFTMMGYQRHRVTQVGVASDLTTNIDAIMSTEVIKGEAVTVIAERPMVKKDLTATTAIVNADRIESMPVTEVGDIVGLQAGMVNGHMRGGRSGEVAYWIDGVPVTDVYDGGQLIEISKDMIQELQVISGAFNAEYGQAMSGIVNITTKSRFRAWAGSLTLYSGDYYSSHKDVYLGINKINPFYLPLSFMPLSTQNAELSIQGPLISDLLDFSFTTRQVHWEGWLNGRYDYNPWNVSIPIDLTNMSAVWQAEGYDSPLLYYSLGSNDVIDSALVYSMAFTSPVESNWGLLVDFVDPQALADGGYTDIYDYTLGLYKDLYGKGTGDGSLTSMQWNTKRFYNTSVGLQLTNKMRFTMQGSYTDMVWQNYRRDYQYNPYGNITHCNNSYSILGKLVHTLSSTTFYNLGVGISQKNYKKENADGYIVYSELDVAPESYSFKPAGTDNSRFERTTTTRLMKFDMISQVNASHQVKLGVEGRSHVLTMKDYTIQPLNRLTLNYFEDPVMTEYRIPEPYELGYSEYNHHPVEFSSYIQDKIELKELIINIGVRFDYMDPDGQIPVDLSDPSIYSPLKYENIYNDTDNDGVLGSAGDTYKTYEERMAYWFKDATAKWQISPRFGASFPITDKGVIHVSYGHFLQMPQFELLYRNPDYDLGTGTGNVGLVGNPDLKPEKTISGEIGLKQEVSDGFAVDITAYFRDIRDLVGTRNAEIDLALAGATYSRIENSDFAYIKGLVFSLNYTSSQGYYGSFDYTYQIAKGSASDPEEARNAASSGSLPEIYLTSLNWDQTHTINVNAGYDQRYWGMNLIGTYGSGMPYTPHFVTSTGTTDISSILTNSQTKPYQVNFDLNVYYNTELFGTTQRWFMRINNLFDRLNQNDVYAESGRADFTSEEERISSSLIHNNYINTIADYFNDETKYSEPRRVEMGVTINF